jgi:hypothetical protein
MLAVLAAFFCLLFFAAAKKSRCRPAQGRRLKHEGKARMPAKTQNHTGKTCAANTASRMPAKEQTKTGHATKANRGCQRKHEQNQTARHEGKTPMPAQTPTPRAAAKKIKP